MIAHDLDSLGLKETLVDDKEEEFSIPIDISDIINICREYNKLGWQIQNQVESILEVGIEASIKANILKKESLSHIKNFLKHITDNAYFGDAVTQSEDCIKLIEAYESKHKVKVVPRFN